MKSSILIKIAILCLLIPLLNCSKSEIDPVTGKKKRFEPNVRERVNTKDGIIFSNKGNNAGTFDFATSNPLWRASLKVIEFMPLSSASYSGGIITTDWYSGSANTPEELKITIRFLSDELNINSINVTSYKRVCTNSMSCTVGKGSLEVSKKIKEKIIEEARKISIEQSRKKK